VIEDIGKALEHLEIITIIVKRKNNWLELRNILLMVKVVEEKEDMSKTGKILEILYHMINKTRI